VKFAACSFLKTHLLLSEQNQVNRLVVVYRLTYATSFMRIPHMHFIQKVRNLIFI